MIHHPSTIPIGFVNGVLAGLASRGESPDGYLRGAHIDAELFQCPGARITSLQYVALVRLLVNGLDDDFLGLFSRPLRRGSFAMIARAGLGAPTLRVAIQRMVKTFGLLQDDIAFALLFEGDLCGLAAQPVRTSPASLNELLVRTFWRVFARYAGGTLKPVRFDFSHARPAYAEFYGEVFPAPVRFGRSCSGIWVDARALDQPVRLDEYGLLCFMSEVYEHIVDTKRRDDPISTRVRSHLQMARPHWPNLASTARSMNMGISTLQKHLSARGTSFQALKDEVRRDLAIRLLTMTSIPLTQLPDELGFADSASFQRAFKDWTGAPPGVYRRCEVSSPADRGRVEGVLQIDAGVSQLRAPHRLSSMDRRRPWRKTEAHLIAGKFD